MCNGRTHSRVKLDLRSSIIQGGPAVQRFSGIFSPLLQLFPRLEFEQAVKKSIAPITRPKVLQAGASSSPCSSVNSAALIVFVRSAEAWPAARASSNTSAFLILPNDLPWPTLMPIGRGRSTRQSSSNCWESASRLWRGAEHARSSGS